MSFLAGDSEMARRIREFDWTNHPFGPPETWPQSLRSALSICLHSAFPTAIYWGGELRLLYNDAWAPIPGPRHPAALGAPAREVWSDIWHVIEPQFIHLISTGEGIFVEDQLLPMRRYGVPEETYWTYSFTAIRGEDGAIEGVFNSGSEKTDEVLHRRQVQFLLRLNEELRACGDPRAARRLAVELLGRHMGASRAGIREIVTGGGGENLELIEEWTAPGVSPLGRELHLRDYGETPVDTLLSGRVLRLDDAEAGIGEPLARAAFAEVGVRSILAVPWTRDGRAEAVLYIHSEEPRLWTDYDAETLEEVLETTMIWIERERAAERERIMAREIDHRSRNTLAIVQSLVRLTEADDVAAFRARIVNRIEALSHAHGLLASRRWRDVELEDLLREELGPYDDGAGRTALRGPMVKLPPDFAQMAAMLVHELATNAAKHGALRAPEGRLEVTWEVRDDALDLLWAERCPAARPSAPRPGGGFGSTLLSQVAGQLGGRIEQTSTPDGLRCALTLPLRREAEGAAARRAPGAPPLRAAGGAEASRSVLIVEDEAIVAMDMAQTVQDLGYEVFAVANSVKKGLEALASATPDLAVLDADLAGRSSRPIADLLRERDVPFVIVTGYDSPPDVPEDGPRAAVLSKPISERELASRLDEIVRRRGAPSG